MKFKLIINKEKDEEIIATVHKRTQLIDKIEALIANERTADEIIGCLQVQSVFLPLYSLLALP